MIWWYVSPAACWSFQKVLRGHYGTFENIPLRSDGNPRSASVAVNYIQIFNFTGASTPHQCCNTIPSSISVSFPPSRFPVPPPFFPHWHNSNNNASVPPHQTPTKEREGESEGQKKRETENYSAGRNVIVHQRKTEGKKLPLKLIIYPWEEKPQCLSLCLSMCCSLSFCLSHGANCLHATSVYFYTLLSKPFLWDQIQLSIRFFIFLCSAPLFIYSAHIDNIPQINQNMHSSWMISSFKWSIHPKPSLICFPLDLWQLIPYLWTSPVSVLGDKDIFSLLELLAQWIIIQFHGKAQTAFFVSYTKLIFYLLPVAQLFLLVMFTDNVWAVVWCGTVTDFHL